MKVKAKHAFVHGEFNVERGGEIDVNDSLAGELARRGLVEVPKVEAKMAAPPANKMAAALENKAAPPAVAQKAPAAATESKPIAKGK